MNNNSNKRKNSFANDRLKKLRTSLNTDVALSSNIEVTSKLDSRPCLNKSIPNNPQRKKLKARRKLKGINIDRDIKNTNEVKKNSTIIDVQQIEILDVCTPKRQKVELLGTKVTPLYEKLNNGIFTSAKNVNTKKAANYLEKRFQDSTHRNDNLISSNHTNDSENVNKSSVSTRLPEIRSAKSSNFSDICSSKVKFDYQHIPELQKTQTNCKSTGQCMHT